LTPAQPKGAAVSVFPSLPSGRRVLLLDVLVALWAAAWIAVGVVVHDKVEALTGLTGGFDTVGGAIETSGRAMEDLRVPLIGRPLEGTGREVAQAGRSVTGTGREARDDVETAAVLLGLTAALVPVLSVLLLYGPARYRRASDAASVRRMLAEAGGDPRVEWLLAERAVHRLSYRRLRAVSGGPIVDLEEGRYRALAEEELRRLGVSERRPV
jgi:hypothetical protein